MLDMFVFVVVFYSVYYYLNYANSYYVAVLFVVF